MSQKITCNVNNPAVGGLAAIELVKATNPIAVEWGKESTISFGSDTPKFVYNSENDILRFIGRVAGKFKLYGSNPVEQTQIDQWLAFSLTLGNDLAKSLAYLEKCLGALTYLVTNNLTIADLAVFSQLSRQMVAAKKIGIPVYVQRWYNLIGAQECVKQAQAALPAEAKKALSTAAETATNRQATGERKQEGKFVDLPNAEMGKVIVRFPPEASGYLHIGHAKAALLNQHYANAFKGKLIMRFDDTNPAKETVEFEQVILGDLELLEIKPDLFTHTSNYFDLMLEYCERMLKEGKAYVDDTEPEQMKKDREQRIESVHRNNSYEKNLKMWKEMLIGSAAGKKCCVRAKIDMGSHNGCMRDPTIYRCKDEEHPRTGRKYKVYPTYDFACPIVDAIEGVTHTLRTTEYHDRNPQFNWFIEALNLRRPEIYDYSRLNMTNTVLSKRRLTWFVDEGLVDGWDDPRFPTVRGILRRGLTVPGLREFIIAQGSSKSVVFMEWDKIWAFNKKVIDPIAPRYTALTLNKTVVVNVAGVTKAEQVQVAAHPKNPEVGQKTIWTGPRILIDYEDAEMLKEGENTTFINWGNLLIKKINRNASKKITSIDAVPNLENKDYKKTIKLTWLYEGASKDDFPPTVCVYFEHIISKAVLGKDEDFKQYVAKDTRREVPMLGDPELKKCKVGDIIQLQRRGFFRVDNAYAPPSIHTGKASPVILFEIPDGSQKSSTATSAAAKVTTASSSALSSSADDLNERITKQGNLVRDLKSQKADKAKIDAAVKTLLALKTDFKTQTGKDWTPNAAPVKKESSPVSGDLNDQITKQGNLVRDLKSKKADKSEIDAAVKTLLALKADFKTQTGKDWTPNAAPVKTEPSPASGDLNDQITKQGNLVRDLKSKKAGKAEVDAAVKTLLALKTDFKTQTGKDWTPNAAPVTNAAPVKTEPSPASGDLNDQITKQGNLVRDLKSKKAGKAEVDAAVKTLLALKTDFKTQTGKDWTPNAAPVTNAAPVKTESSSVSGDLNDQITKQGNLVRDLKSKKADKSQIDAAVKTLLALKADYKTQTGKDWTPNAAPVKTEPSPASGDLNDQITKQGNLVRDLKSKKANKVEVDAAVKTLLALKAEFKAQTGADWLPGAIAPEVKPIAVATQAQAGDIVQKIVSQGDLVRDLKTKKADKSKIDSEVKTLLALKAEYKAQTGQEYKPGATAPSTQNNASQLNEKIAAQGNAVRDLKAQKADKSKIDAEVKTLLALKTEYKTLTGNDWKPDAAANAKATTTPPTTMEQPPSNDATQLNAQIAEQGNTVRVLKEQKADKAKIDAEVKTLLDLKGKYKALTGQDWKPEGDAGKTPRSKAPKPAKEAKPKPAEKEKPADGGVKKVTRLGLEATKEENLPEWYSQVLTKAELIEYYDVSGCYILRDWSFAIWKVIQRWFTDEIDKLGVKEVYFPMFVSKAALEKEKAHIADFSPEVAWVTKSGDSDLAEPVAIRPTSETVMYPTFAKWIQSYRDLPIKINQWSNVVRWEFKHPQPFLRTREFLWQEGHTAYEKKEDADAEVLTILDLYSRIYSELLAVPTMKGRKTTKEKFAGGDYTTTVEAYISASGRAIQGGTSHHLGQNFSKMFEIIYTDPETKEKKYVYQNSWGLTTRTIGVMIMIHGDNKGLVLPPNVASIQAIIVPCGLTVNTKPEEKEELLANCKSLQATLKAAQVRVDGDYRDNYSPGWKFNHWELKGVPIRIELGPKDMKAKQLVAVRRDTGEKLTIQLSEVSTKIPALLKQIHSDMFNKAKKEFDEHIDIVHNWSDFVGGLSKKNLLLTPFCGDETCEKHIKDNSANNEADTEVGALAMGAKSLCIPFDQPKSIEANTKCINPNCTLKPSAYTLFGRSY